MKYDLARMLKEIEEEKRGNQPEPKRKLSQSEIRDLIQKRKKVKK